MQLARRPASTIGLVFSSEGFTPAARQLAQFLAPQTILLWEGAEVEFALRNSLMAKGLRAKFDHAVEMGLPDYNLREQVL
jgi:hypothetical protein